MSRSQAADAALVWNTIVWGSTFVLVKNALAGISPVLFLALRFSLATAILLVLFRGLGKGPYTGRSLAAGAVTGTFLFAGYLFQTWGLRLTSAPKSAFLTGLNTVMVPLLAALVYKIKPRRSELVGVLAATAGLALMTLQGGAGSGSVNRGDLLTIVCALAFAAHIVTLGHFSEQVSFELLSVMQVGVAALWSLALFGWVEPPRLAVAPERSLRDTDNGGTGHGHGVYHPGVGPAVYDFHPHGADLYAGAGFCRDHLLSGGRRRAFSPRRRRGGSDFGRRPVGGIETVESPATSIRISHYA